MRDILFIPVPYISLLSWVPLVFAIYRMFSRQIGKRQEENYAWLRKWGRGAHMVVES